MRVASLGNQNSFKHGMTDSPTYMTWVDMKRRCFDPSRKLYPLYGGRGITVCERWLEFANFLADMGEKPDGLTLDRIDNERGYEPGNCRWASSKDQARNRRSNRLLTMGGETKTVMEWAEQTGILKTTIIERLNRGWPVDRALTERPR